MGHIGNELAQGGFHLPIGRQVVQRQQDAVRAAAERCGYGVQETALRQKLYFSLAQYTGTQGQSRDLLNLVVTQRLHQSRADRVSRTDVKKPFGCTVHQRDPPVSLYHDYAVLHSVQHCRQLGAFRRHVAQHAAYGFGHAVERYCEFLCLVRR